MKKAAQADFPDSITGFDLMLDNVHPNANGAYFISSKIADFIKNAKIVNGSEGEPHDIDSLFAVMGINDEEFFSQYLKTAQYALKHPFVNLQAASEYGELAKGLQPNNWQIIATDADIKFLGGNIEEGRKLVGEAEVLKGSKITKDDVADMPYLKLFVN